MSLKAQFKLISGLMVVILTTAVGLNIYVSRLNQTASDVAARRYQSYLIADELRQNSQDLTRCARTFCMTGDSQYEQEYFDILAVRSGEAPRPQTAALHPDDQIAQRDIMTELGFTDSEFALLDQAASLSGKLVATETKAMNAVKGFEEDGITPFKGSTFNGREESGSELAARLMFDHRYHDEVKKIMHPINEFLAEMDHRTRAEVTEATRSASAMQNVISGIAIFSALSMVFLVIYQIRSVFTPLTRFAMSFEQLASGDMTQKVSTRARGEMKQLAEGYNTLTQKLNSALKRVTSVTSEVAGAATQIAASSEEMASSMGEQSAQVEQIASAVEEMSASVTEVAGKSNQAAENARRSGEIATEGGEVVRKTIEGMRAIDEAVLATSESVSELGRRGEQIGQIIEVINDIADQTNLLALNAAIEAARAGEMGRGFAVVADEVRKLAERTTKATEEVAQSILAIQDETKQAVTRMETGRQRATEGVTLTSSAGESLQRIVNETRGVSDMIVSIAAATEQQSASSEQVSRSIEQISAVAREANAGCSQAAQAASQLSCKAEELQQLVSMFKLDDTAA